MAKRKISIEVYQLNLKKSITDSNKLLKQLFEDELNNKSSVRAEVVYKVGEFQEKNGYYIGTMINHKRNGHPVASDQKLRTQSDLPLKPTEDLGFMNLFIYDSYTQIIFIENIQNGVTIDKLIGYFMVRFSPPFKIKHSNVLDAEILNSYKKLSRLKSLTFQIARVSSGAIFNSSNSTVKGTTQLSNDLQAGKITVKYAATGRKESLKISKSRELIELFRSWNSNAQTTEVEKIILEGESDEIPFKPIDLISEIMKRFIFVESVRSNNYLSLKEREFELEALFLKERENLISAYNTRKDD